LIRGRAGIHIVARALPALAFLLVATVARADTIRVITERAIIWSTPTGVAVVLNQVPRDTVLMEARRIGDWYEVELPPGSSGADVPAAPGSRPRVGYIRAFQVRVEAVAPVTRPAPTAAQAQAAQRPVLRGQEKTAFLNIGAGYQLGSTDLTRHLVAFKDTYAEEGSIDANYGKSSGFLFDVVGGARVAGHISVGFGISYARHDEAATVDAHVPHPFLFQTLRDATFTTASLSGQELVMHIPILWTQSFRSATRITIFGGPSIFHVTQDFVTNVTLNEVYPYDSVTITDTSQSEISDNAFGFHVGAGVTQFFGPTVGAGVDVRYSRASLDFADDANATTAARAGGLQVTGGVRFRF
jgi:opacity protein-like surface antigen